MTREEHIKRAEELLATWDRGTDLDRALVHATLAVAMKPDTTPEQRPERRWWVSR